MSLLLDLLQVHAIVCAVGWIVTGALIFYERL